MNWLQTKILHVDLAEGITRTENRPELLGKYIGGAGLASKLLLEECPPNTDPLSSKAPIILATGPLTGLFPAMTKAVAMFKSPLTGNLGESYSGGHLSTALRFANYCAIVIKGSSHVPVCLAIQNGDVRIEDASSLWSRSPLEVEEKIKFGSGGAESVMSIGRAGENCVNYSNAIVDHYGHFGRLGLGAVMGSKRLKAIHVYGTNHTPITEGPEINDFRAEVNRLLNQTDVMKKYKELGTAANLLALNAINALPTRNFSKSTFDKAEKLSGENFVRTVLERKTSCPGCPTSCIHVGTLNSGRQDGGQRETPREREGIPYNYQPIFALGTNLEVSDPKGVLRLIGSCEGLGMDAIMTGAVLAWATEAYEKGLIDTDETIGVKPSWGNVVTYLNMIEQISNQSNEFYASLAHGVAAAAERYGGVDFAVSLGKNSPAGYLTGYGNLVGTLVGARHSHLSNAGYSIDQTHLSMDPSPEAVVESLLKEEDWLNIFNSLVGCYFSRGVYKIKIVVRALAAAGVDTSEDELNRIGREISLILYNFKRREGFDLYKERIPKRLIEVEGPSGRLDPRIIERMISHYVKMRERAELLCLQSH